MSVSDSYCTPPEIADPLEEFFEGPVDVDPCSNERSIIRARLALTSGGLILPWRLQRPVRRTVYENFPYSAGDLWTQKALGEMAQGNVTELVRLSMMATSTEWWANMCHLPRRNPRILALQRIWFLVPPRVPPIKFGPCRFEPALTYFGPRARKFDRCFAHLTRWSTWGRS